jgi:hypothetical protein
MRASKGVHRLALLLGAVASTAWVFFLMVATQGFQEVKTGGHFALIVLFTGISFLIPFLLVHGIAWVIRGFREDK